LNTVIKIKKALIDKAKIKKEYAKLKERNPEFQQKKETRIEQVKETSTTADEDEEADVARALRRAEAGAPEDDEDSEVEGEEEEEEKETQTDQPKPEAKTEVAQPETENKEDMHADRFQRQKRQKIMPFTKQVDVADARRRATEERRQRIETANRERTEKIEERERFRRAMAKARTGGKNGQRKLGRESSVLLEKVQRMVGK